MERDHFLALPILDEYALPILLSVFVVLLIGESLLELRPRKVKRWQRWVTNGSVAVIGLPAARLLLLPVTVWVAWWAGARGIGLLNWLELPGWANLLLGMLVLDYGIYVWHRLNHIWPFLWRFHQVHHADLDMDITTAIRFHVGEMVLSIPFRLVVILLSGVSPVAILVYEIIFEAATLFHHSNIRLPLWLERFLAWFIITPRIHGIHHSIVKEETDSNYGTVLNWWDRLHRSARFKVPQSVVNIGIPQVRQRRQNTLLPLLVMPFRRLLSWRLPSGEVPERKKVFEGPDLPD